MATDTSKTALTTIGGPAHACWFCGDIRAAHFCTSCGKVQPPQPADYFSFFGLPRKLDLNEAALQRSFYELSRELHPDVYARASGQEQEWSTEKTSQLNDAYRTLKDPIRRTEYLLKLEGVQLEEQSKAATEAARVSGAEKKQAVPPELLEEVFELNMQLEEMRMSKNLGERDADLVQEVEEQKQSLEQKLEDLSGELKSYWKEWDEVVDRDSAWEERKAIRNKMVDLLNRRNYIRNLVRDVNEVLES